MLEGALEEAPAPVPDRRELTVDQCPLQRVEAFERYKVLIQKVYSQKNPSKLPAVTSVRSPKRLAVEDVPGLLEKYKAVLACVESTNACAGSREGAL